MSLPMDELDIAVEAIIGREFMKRLDQRIIQPHPALMSRLLSLHKAVGGLAHEFPIYWNCRKYSGLSKNN